MDYYNKSIVYLELGIKGGRYLKKKTLDKGEGGVWVDKPGN